MAVYTLVKIVEQGTRIAGTPEGKADREQEFDRALELAIKFYTGKPVGEGHLHGLAPYVLEREDWAKDFTEATVLSHRTRRVKANPHLLAKGDYVGFRREWKVDFR